MRLALLSFALVTTMATAPAKAATADRSVAPVGDLHLSYMFTPAGKSMPYRLFVPRTYDPAKPSPLVVVLHGGGGDENGPLDRSTIEAVAETRGYLVLSPRGYTPFGGYGDVYPIVVGKASADASGGFREASRTGINPPPPATQPTGVPPPAKVEDYVEQPAGALIDPASGILSEQETLAALEQVRAHYNVDPGRIYLMGNSMGGVGTLYLAAKYPRLWAAVSPSDGPIASWSYPFSRLRDAGLPILFVHGAIDERSNPHWSEVEAADARAQGVEARFLPVANGRHGSAWTMVLPDIFDFFDSHRRSEAK